MDIIETSQDLAKLCADLARDSYVTVDTEFMREHTFWPVLCLIQIAGSSHEAIIDPLAEGMDLAPFWDLMANENVLKVFHAARQDVEIVYHMGGIVPHPLFDTQIAAMVCGFGDQVGYEALVSKLADGRIDKSSRFTDWSRRPLTSKQLAYALSDVTHLRTVYEALKARLDQSGREHWLNEEMDILTSPETYKSEPVDAWQRIKFKPRNKRQLGVMMAVAEWREKQARKRNVPRNRVVKDDVIVELAVQQPKDRNALKNLRALSRGHATSNTGEELLKAVRRGLDRDPATIPEPPNGRPNQPEGTGAASDVLKLALKIIAEREGIAPKLIASASDIEKIAAGDDNVHAMHGWRREVFGDIAVEIRAGRTALGFRDKQVAVIPLRQAPGKLEAAE